MPVKSSKRKRDSLEQQFQHDDEFTFIRTRSKTAAAARASLDNTSKTTDKARTKVRPQEEEPKNGNIDKRNRNSTSKNDKTIIPSEKDSRHDSASKRKRENQNNRKEDKSIHSELAKERADSDKNHNFRKLQARRSSVRQRGKRASSIGNGFETSLHPAIPPEEFYKHLDCNLPEPHQMKQLLVWCSRRALTERSKHSSYSPAETIAKVVVEKLVQNLADGRISTSWWWRESQTNDAKSLKPNPKNEENKKNLQNFQHRLTELEKEKQQWTNLRQEMSNQTTKLIQDAKTPNSLSIPEDMAGESTQHEKFPDGLEIQADIDKLTASSHLMESLADISTRTGKHYLSVLASQQSAPEDATVQDTTRAELRALSRLP